MVTLIHNVLTTDYVTPDPRRRLRDGPGTSGAPPAAGGNAAAGCRKASWRACEGVFGISGICNILGAIRMARHLNLGPADNVVTIATDGFDRYPSVLADLAERCGPIDAGKLDGWFESMFRGGTAADILDVRPRAEKERLFGYKENVWSGFGYSHAYLERMKSQAFWESQFDAIAGIDRALLDKRCQPA